MARSGSGRQWGRGERERQRASGGEMRPLRQGSGGQGGCPNGGWGSRSVGRRERVEAPVCFFEVADRWVPQGVFFFFYFSNPYSRLRLTFLFELI